MGARGVPKRGHAIACPRRGQYLGYIVRVTAILLGDGETVDGRE